MAFLTEKELKDFNLRYVVAQHIEMLRQALRWLEGRMNHMKYDTDLEVTLEKRAEKNGDDEEVVLRLEIKLYPERQNRKRVYKTIGI